MRQSGPRTLTDALDRPTAREYVGGARAHAAAGRRVIVERGFELGVASLDVPKAAADVLSRNRRVGWRDTVRQVRWGGWRRHQPPRLLLVGRSAALVVGSELVVRAFLQFAELLRDRAWWVVPA